MGRLVLLACSVLLAAAPAPAQQAQLETIVVNNRPAEDLVPVVQPLVGAGGSVTAYGSRLIVKAAPAALREIKALVATLDVVPRSLWITVRQSQQAEASQRQAGVSGGVVIERKDGTTTTTRTRVTGAFGQGSSSETGQDVQQLRALEGRPSFIQVGRAVPVSQGVPGGAVYQEAASGFHVTPWLAGDLVSLEIRTQADRIDDAGRVEFQQIRATVSGRLGEWISLGGLQRTESVSERGLLSHGDAKLSELRTVSLKVMEVP